MLDWAWRDNPHWTSFRDDLLPRLVGTPYGDAPRWRPSKPCQVYKGPPLDPDLVEDTRRCINLMRAKIWSRIGPRCSVRSSEAMIEQILDWLEHLSLTCSTNLDLLHLDFSVDLPEVGTVVHHNSRYGLTYASAAGAVTSNIPEAAVMKRLAEVLDDKFRALRDWISARPHGFDDLARYLGELQFELEERRFSTEQRAALPEFVSVSFSHYDGEIRRKTQPVRVRNRVKAIPHDQTGIVAGLHMRRFALAVNRRRDLQFGVLTPVVAQQQESFDSLAAMAKRWRWLVEYPHASSSIESFLRALPAKTFTNARDVLEYVNLQVDIAMLEASWGDSSEPVDALCEAESCAESRRRDALWWLWYSAEGSSPWTKPSRGASDRLSANMQAAMSRARQVWQSEGGDFVTVIDLVLRESGHIPEMYLAPTKSEAPFSDMLKAFTVSPLVAGQPPTSPDRLDTRRRRAA
jgi:hypothetical protein